jgi:hypothetical protein
MNFLNNIEFNTSIILTDYAKQNNKTVKDIVKIAISDDDIDYNLNNNTITQLVFMSDINNFPPKYLFYSMNNVTSMNFNIIANGGNFALNNDNLNISNTKIVKFICNNVNGIYLAIYDINFISSILIDNLNTLTSNNMKNNHFYIDNTVEITFSNNTKSGKISFFAVNSNLKTDFNILFN